MEVDLDDEKGRNEKLSHQLNELENLWMKIFKKICWKFHNSKVFQSPKGIEVSFRWIFNGLSLIAWRFHSVHHHRIDCANAPATARRQHFHEILSLCTVFVSLFRVFRVQFFIPFAGGESSLHDFRVTTREFHAHGTRNGTRHQLPTDFSLNFVELLHFHQLLQKITQLRWALVAWKKICCSAKGKISNWNGKARKSSQGKVGFPVLEGGGGGELEAPCACVALLTFLRVAVLVRSNVR